MVFRSLIPTRHAQYGEDTGGCTNGVCAATPGTPRAHTRLYTPGVDLPFSRCDARCFAPLQLRLVRIHLPFHAYLPALVTLPHNAYLPTPCLRTTHSVVPTRILLQLQPRPQAVRASASNSHANIWRYGVAASLHTPAAGFWRCPGKKYLHSPSLEPTRTFVATVLGRDGALLYFSVVP